MDTRKIESEKITQADSGSFDQLLSAITGLLEKIEAIEDRMAMLEDHCADEQWSSSLESYGGTSPD